MDMITISAKTLDDAITKAVIELEVTSDKLYYEVVEKGSSGLLGIFGAKQAVIRARKKTEDEVAADLKKKEKATFEKTGSDDKKETFKFVPATPAEDVKKPELVVNTETSENNEKVKKNEKIDVDLISKTAENFLKSTLGAMNMEVSVKTFYDEKERELSLNMEGDNMGILIGKRGQTLDSLQYLVSLVVNKECDGYIRVKLDTENYRDRRKETLENLAKNISYKVKRTKHPVSLEPMNPYERRIIHAALQSDRYVVTRSEGEDPFRHVVISLKRESRDSREYSKKSNK